MLNPEVKTVPERIPSVLIVDDEPRLCALLQKEFERKGFPVHAAGEAWRAFDILGKQRIDVALLDIVLPGEDGISILRRIRAAHPATQVIMLTGNASVGTAVQAMKFGAYDYLSKPYDLSKLIRLIEHAHEEARVRRQNRSLRLELASRMGPTELIGPSPALARTRDSLRRAAESDSPMLIEGELGTGKELAARFIHRESLRADGPFLAADCDLETEAALERLLFGSPEQPGMLLAREDGVVMLSSVERIPLTLQQRLLSHLQETATSLAPMRVIGVSRGDLSDPVREGRFLEELRDVFTVLRVRMPALRERAEDILPLAELFFEKHRQLRENPPAGLAACAKRRLQSYPWPGNARQLSAVLERAVLLCEERLVRASDLSLPRVGTGVEAGAHSLESVERTHILATLAKAGGRKSKAAAMLGIDSKTLYNRLAQYDGEH